MRKSVVRDLYGSGFFQHVTIIAGREVIIRIGL